LNKFVVVIIFVSVTKLNKVTRFLRFLVPGGKKIPDSGPVSLKTKYSFRLQMSLEANYACIVHEKIQTNLIFSFPFASISYYPSG
jgi:hypothetical protein